VGGGQRKKREKKRKEQEKRGPLRKGEEGSFTEGQRCELGEKRREEGKVLPLCVKGRRIW